MPLKKSMKKAIVNSITELFLWAALEFMKEKSFDEAADKIVTIIKAFEFEISLYEPLAESINELNYEDFDKFVSKLIKRIEISKKAAEYFNKPEQIEALTHFSSLLSNHLKKKAGVYDEGKKPEKAIKYLNEAFMLESGDKEIIALRQSIIEKYLNVHIDGIQQNIIWVKGQVSVVIAAACEIIIRLGDKIIFKEKVDSDQLFQGAVSTSFPSGKSEKKPSISKKEGGISFEVYRGLNKGRLTIKLDKLK